MVGPGREELPFSFDKQPWLIQADKSKEQKFTFINPINSRIEEKIIPEMEAKRLLGCFGEWVLLLDELTKECFFLSLISFLEIHIPPFTEPLDSSYQFSLTSFPASPDCVVTFVCYRQNFVLFCGLRDKEWTKLPTSHFDNIDHINMGRSIVHKGRLFIIGCFDEVLVVNIASMIKGSPDEMISYYPECCPITSLRPEYLVECCDDLFLVRVHLRDAGQMVTNIEIHRLLEEDNEIYWDQVWGIGHNAFFLSETYSTSLRANEAGVEPNCIYLVVHCLDGQRLYKFCLEDQSFTFNLVNLETNDTSLINVETEIRSSSDHFTKKNELGDKCQENESRITFSRQWTDLPLELVESFFSWLSLADCMRLSAVCKEWSLTSNSIPKSNAWPWLMHSPSIADGVCKFFDPFNGREYTLEVGALSANEQLTFRFSKDGWVVITEGNETTFILNPFTQEVIYLPTIDRFYFDGISFSGIPTSPDCQVFGFYFHFDGSFIKIFSWRRGEEEWSTEMLPQDDTPFYGCLNNPVLYDGEFYCLDRRGKLGVLDPNQMKWRVLSKPEPIHSEITPFEDESCDLLELRGDLIAVFRRDDTSAIRVFKLDRSKMAWNKLEDLGDITLFVGRRNSIAVTSPLRSCSNKIYFPKFDGRDHKMGVFYSMDEQTYHPRFYGLEEPTTSIWLQPNIASTLA